MPADLIKNTPSRTLHCDGREFRRLRSLARSGRPLSLCCLPVLSPLCLFYRIWCALAAARCLAATGTCALCPASTMLNLPEVCVWRWSSVDSACACCLYLATVCPGSSCLQASRDQLNRSHIHG